MVLENQFSWRPLGENCIFGPKTNLFDYNTQN